MSLGRVGISTSPGEPKIRATKTPEVLVLANVDLTGLYGQEALFESQKQLFALPFVFGGISPLLVTLSTGGGKSILFEGLAKKGSDAIVVIPLIALHADLDRRALSHGLDSQGLGGRLKERTEGGVSEEGPKEGNKQLSEAHIHLKIVVSYGTNVMHALNILLQNKRFP